MNDLKYNPVRSYRDLKEKIPLLKEELSNFLNEYHGLKKSKEFWWAIAGEYALHAEYFSTLAKNDERLFFELERCPKSNIPSKDISSILVNLIGRDVISGVHKGFIQNLEECSNDESCFFMDEEQHFAIDSSSDVQGSSLPFEKATRFLGRIYDVKNRFLDLGRKVVRKLTLTSALKNTPLRKSLREGVKNDGFHRILELIIPDELTEKFPLWFLSTADLVVNDRCKWRTHFGYELNIFQRILLASSYERFETKNITYISHGGIVGTLSIFELFRLSLFPKHVFNLTNKGMRMRNASGSSSGHGILYCPAQFPWVSNLVSLKQWREIIKAHEATIKLLRSGISQGKNIKIRYKDFPWLHGYSGQFMSDDSLIPTEEERFEDVYWKYSSIVSVPYGTIAAQCHASDINCLVYHHAYFPTDMKSHRYITSLSGVHDELDTYLAELSRLIDAL